MSGRSVIIYTRKLLAASKKVNDLSKDNNISYDKSLELRKLRDTMNNKVIFITNLQKAMNETKLRR